MKKAKSRLPHNYGKKYVKGLGYVKPNYQKDNVLSFLRAFSICVALTLGCACVRLHREDIDTELVNPWGGTSNFIVRAVEPEVNPCTQENEIEQYICEVFGEDYEDAMAILSCENKGLVPDATNDQNSNGSIDVGIFQINSIHGFTEEEMKDWKKNIDFAHKLFKRDGWSAWACSRSTLNIKSFWE